MMRVLAILVAFIFPSVSVAAYPSMVIIISHDSVETSNLEALRNLGVVGYSLNIHAPTKLLERLNDNQTTDVQQLKEEVLGKIKNITEEEKLSFFRPAILIKQLGIKKLPVVIYNNGEEIAYGVTDFLEAIDIWEKTR